MKIQDVKVNPTIALDLIEKMTGQKARLDVDGTILIQPKRQPKRYKSQLAEGLERLFDNED